MKTVTVSEAALDSLKAMGQRDKKRIEQLEWILCIVGLTFSDLGEHPRLTKAIRDVLVTPYSETVIEKAE